jgi:hypothetical protein
MAAWWHDAGMAQIITDGENITLRLSAGEKMAALHGDITVPRTAVTGVRAVSDGLAELRGIRAPGTGIPGVLMLGTLRGPEGKSFVIACRRRPAVVIDLIGASFDHIVAVVPDPERTVRELTAHG